MKKKSSETDQLTGHFQSFFFYLFLAFFFFPQYFQKKNSKTSKANQQSVLNILSFFPKNLGRTISYNSVTLKNTDRTSKIYYCFQQNK